MYAGDVEGQQPGKDSGAAGYPASRPGSRALPIKGARDINTDRHQKFARGPPPYY